VFVALGIHYAMRIRHVSIFGQSGCTNFLTQSHTRRDFWKSLLNKICFDYFYKFVWNILIIRRSERDMVIKVNFSSCKLRLILVGFYWSLKFSADFRKLSNINFYENSSNESRVVLWGRQGRQTERKDEVKIRSHFK
jgi:hypothetical protein